MQQIRVFDPFKSDLNQAIYYKIEAFDLEGMFECNRRFSDFEALRKSWVLRLPGLFIPNLTVGKKWFSSKTRVFLEERCFFLSEFLKKVYKL